MTKIELTRRRILGGLITIGAGSAAAGAGTFALFSDTESNNNNTVDAGTLDLQTGNTNTLNFSASDIAPTATGTADTDLEKSGTVVADLNVSVPTVDSTEGDNPESEGDTDTSNGGELANQLELNLWIGTGGSDDNSLGSGDIVLNSDGTSTTGGSANYETVNNYEGTTWSGVITDFAGPATFNIDWRFPDAADNNDAQGDTVSVDFQFELVQQ